MAQRMAKNTRNNANSKSVKNTRNSNTKSKNKTNAKTVQSGSKKSDAHNNSEHKNLNNEIQGTIVVAIALLVFACLFIKNNAPLPGYIACVMFGAFGLGAYLIPIFVLVLGVCRIILKKLSFHIGKIVSTIVFILGIWGLLHIILSGDGWMRPSFSEAISSVFADASNAVMPLSMGAFSVIFLHPLISLFGTVASVIILVCAIAISIILLFNFSYREAGKKVKAKIDRIHDNNIAIQNNNSDKINIRHRQIKMYDECLDDESPKSSDVDKRNRHIIAEDDDKEFPLSFEMSETTNRLDNFAHTDDDIINNPFENTIDSSFPELPDEPIAFDENQSPEIDNDENESNNDQEQVSAEFNSFDLPDDRRSYVFPPISLLSPAKPIKNHVAVNYSELAAKLERTLASFGIKAHVINYTVGPAITRYELTIQEGIRVNKILQLSDDIALCMAATGVRIEAPIPGKSAIGIEIPNTNVTTVSLREVLDSDNFNNHSSCVAIGLGKDITGRAIVADIAKMPHLLIAGQTGSGKSVAINSLIVSLLYKATPEEVRLILVDPKQVELSIYNGIPHLLLPVVTDPKKAAGALQYVVRQMEMRYREFNKHKVKDIYRYNDQARENGEPIMPRIVVIVDELNDLMMVCPGEVEDSVLRIAQLARAAGIYLVLATQRPSVNVITGVIKANIPSRMAFAVSSSHDSKTILDRVGAERLVGRGDMLYHHNGESKPLRIQGAYVDEDDIEQIVNFVKDNSLEPEYIDEEEISLTDTGNKGDDYDPEEDVYDELIFKAVEIVMQCEQASISLLQRKLGIGYARAGRLIDSMEKMNIVGPSQGSKSREILITYEQFVQNFKRK